MSIKIPRSATREQKLLRNSIIATLILSLSSIIFGLWVKSSSITFDGFYNLTDAVMTYVALIAAKMIMMGENERFQYGSWHLEPLLIFINGLVLGLTCTYAFVDGLTGLFSGGRLIQFGPGAFFAALTFLLSLVMYIYIKQSSKNIKSELLEVDARAWFIGAVLSVSLFLSFLIGGFLHSTQYAHLAAYVDPFVLTITALFLLPFPLVTLWAAAKEILQIAPPELSEQVQNIAENIALKYGFVDYSSHVAKSGRQQFIEIGLVSPSGDTVKSFAELDMIRQEIADQMGGLGPGYWLTVDFTADKRWV